MSSTLCILLPIFRKKMLSDTHAQVATKVAEEALSQGLGNIQKPSEGLHKFITDRMWDPRKPNLNLSSNVEA